MNQRASEVYRIVDEAHNALKLRPADGRTIIANAKTQLSAKRQELERSVPDGEGKDAFLRLADEAFGFLGVCEVVQSGTYDPLCESALRNVEQTAGYLTDDGFRPYAV
jgi:hypothetical protein